MAQTEVINWTYVRRKIDGVHQLVGTISKSSSSFDVLGSEMELYTVMSPEDKGDHLLFKYNGYNVKALKAYKKKEK